MSYTFFLKNFVTFYRLLSEFYHLASMRSYSCVKSSVLAYFPILAFGAQSYGSNSHIPGHALRPLLTAQAELCDWLAGWAWARWRSWDWCPNVPRARPARFGHVSYVLLGLSGPFLVELDHFCQCICIPNVQPA